MKKYSLGLLAVIFAVGSSFAVKTYTQVWKFNGSSTVAADRVDPTKYDNSSISCTGNEEVLCAIVAEADPNNSARPEITTSLHTALQNSNLSEPDFEAPGVMGKE